MRLARLEARRLRLPLETPYKLAFGPVVALDTVVVRVALENGSEGYGEATLLTGYTGETIEGTWTKAAELADAAGEEGFDLPGTLERHALQAPFLVTAFRTAIEMAHGSPHLVLEREARVPILGLLQGETGEALQPAADRLIAQGFRTLKFKVGFDPARDAEAVAAVQRAVAGRARIRIDANQGYDAPAAIDFVSRLSNESIELFEQPCAADDWDAHALVVPAARARGIPLMLDESIYSEREIDRAAEGRFADFIKVKLMKFGSLERLVAALERIRARGLVPVLGNGVASDPGCWMEACVAARHIDNAGEMNGFLKPRTRLFADPLRFDDGAIVIPPRWRPRLDEAAIEGATVARASARMKG